MPEIQDRLPRTSKVLGELLANANPMHLHKLDSEIEQAIMKAWVAVHGTGQRRSL